MKREMIETVHYYLENGKVVFTPFYHMERGKCCGNKCRHYPYFPKYEKGTTELNEQFKEERLIFDKRES